MAMPKKRIIEITLARMNTTLNEVMRDEQMHEPVYACESGKDKQGASYDCRDRSFERTQSMSNFLWN